MALNSEQLIQKFLSVRYPYPKGNCRIARNEVLVQRIRAEKKWRGELKDIPEETKREILNGLIEKELDAIS